MPFILNEDEALKKHLSGITVSDPQDAQRDVKVWFRLPEMEERPRTFPFLSIDLVDLSEDVTRAHRGTLIPQYLPEGSVAIDTNHIGVGYEFPIPYNLDYIVTSHTRSAWQDRQLTGQLLGPDRIPHRFGQLAVEQDNTVRRLDLLNVTPTDIIDADNKRHFRKMFYVRMSAELFPETVQAVYKVLTVNSSLLYQGDVAETYVIA